MLRVASGELWKQDIDRIEFWNDMTHDQVGAKIIGQDVPLSQSLVRGGAKVSTYQDWSLELHGYSRNLRNSYFSNSFRGRHRANRSGPRLRVSNGTSVRTSCEGRGT
jgi:hypothetical protein